MAATAIPKTTILGESFRATTVRLKIGHSKRSEPISCDTCYWILLATAPMQKSTSNMCKNFTCTNGNTKMAKTYLSCRRRVMTQLQRKHASQCPLRIPRIYVVLSQSKTGLCSEWLGRCIKLLAQLLNSKITSVQKVVIKALSVIAAQDPGLNRAREISTECRGQPAARLTNFCLRNVCQDGRQINYKCG